jgi:excisionase family DNA binding protein
MKAIGRVLNRPTCHALDDAGESPPNAEATTPTSLPDWARGSGFPGPNVVSRKSRPRSTDAALSIPQDRRSGDLMTVPETASRLRVSTKTVRRVIARGELHAVRIGRAIRIHPEEIERLIKA